MQGIVSRSRSQCNYEPEKIFPGLRVKPQFDIEILLVAPRHSLITDKNDCHKTEEPQHQHC